MDQSIFKAYDVRGRYPSQLDEAAAAGIAGVLAKKWKKGLVTLGKDARLSSSSIYSAVRKIFDARGFEVIEIGLCTTPMFYFLTKRLKSVGGMMVTASHSPKDFNGLKVMDGKGGNISGEQIKRWMG